MLERQVVAAQVVLAQFFSVVITKAKGGQFQFVKGDRQGQIQKGFQKTKRKCVSQ